MKGYNFNSRCGESINKNIQMNNLIAQNEEEYISIATNLSNNKNQLIEVRKKLFDNASLSPLFDKKTFNSDFFELIHRIVKA